MNIPQELVDYQKAIDVIKSSVTPDHYMGASKYFKLWYKKYPESDGKYAALEEYLYDKWLKIYGQNSVHSV